jgi:hypothetical protein
LAVDRLWVSPSLRAAVEAHPRLSIVREIPLTFGAQGAMESPWALPAFEASADRAAAAD